MAAQADTAPTASFSQAAANEAADARAANEAAEARPAPTVAPIHTPTHIDESGDTTSANESVQRSDGVVDRLETRLADPILMVVGPSSSHGLSFQEGDSQFPLPFDALLGAQSAKAVLTGGSRSTKSKASKADLSGAEPHPFLQHAVNAVNQSRASRVDVAYGSSVSRSDRGLGMRGACAHQKVLSHSPSSRRAVTPNEANDTASSGCSDAEEGDQSSSPALRPVNAAVGQHVSWYVPPSGTNSMALRVTPDEPSFSPD